MALTKKSYGLGDQNFSAITAYSRGKEVVAIEIPNGGRSGSAFFMPSPKMLAALQQMEKAVETGNVYKGTHALILARATGATHKGSGFYDNATTDELSTSKIEGSNNAVVAVHGKLSDEGLGIPAFNPLVVEIKTTFSPNAGNPHKRTATKQPQPAL